MGDRNRICPVEAAGSLDNKIRKWLQNPVRILKPYVKEGMTVLDIGCGPGFFTIPIAEITGFKGKVIAADLQEGMLKRIDKKIKGTPLSEIVKLHKCEKNKIGISEKVDFILAFYMVHEVPDKENFLKDLKSLLNEYGTILIIEPKLFHVSRKEFENMIRMAENIGLKPIDYPRLPLSRGVLLKHK